MANEAVTYGAVGGLGGAAIGAGVGYAQAAQARRDAARMRRRTRRGIQAGIGETARSVGGIVSSPEYLAASNFVRQFFGLGNAAADVRESLSTEFGMSPTANVEQRLSRAQAAEGGKGYGMAGTGAFDTLTSDFVRGLRQAQSARGLFESPAAGAGEASGLAAFRANLQLQLLPQLFGLAEGPARLRATYEPSHIARMTGMATGGATSMGPSPFSSALSGGLSGLFSGAGLGIDYTGMQSQLETQRLQQELLRKQLSGGRTASV